MRAVPSETQNRCRNQRWSDPPRAQRRARSCAIRCPRVLDGGVDLLEKAKIVQAALALQHVLLTQWRARLHPHFPAGDSRARVMQTVEKKLIDEKLLAFMNRKGHTNAGQFVR